ncbi:MAG: guanine deaminase [Alphaproteobacteria bacterium]|nr:MAG: guanine deaminase [Alphaproteobacteria bacterium]
MTASAHRGAILHCLDDPAAGAEAVEYIADGLLVIEEGEVAAVGSYEEVAPGVPGSLPVTHHENRLIVPGFIDCHVHAPQLGMIAAPGKQLLDWLETYTYPAEMAWADHAHAAHAAGDFLDALLRHGTTTALVFATSHSHSVDVLFEAALARNMRLVAGKVLMDRNAPEALLEPPARAYAESKALIERWHGRGRLGYAVTPRFAPACSTDMLDVAARLLDAYPDVLLQTHLAENAEEAALVARLFPEARDYLDVYERAGLLGGRSVFAHGVHLDDDARGRLKAADAAIAFCPTSNLFLGSGLFDYGAARDAGLRIGLGTDIGAGTTLSLLATMGEAYKVAQLRHRTIDAFEAFYLATLGAARVLRLEGRIGNLMPGKEADFLVLDPAATPLLAARQKTSRSIAEGLFVLMMLGDERAIDAVYVAGARWSDPARTGRP